MNYGTLQQVYAYLSQLKRTDENDVLLASMLQRATSIIDAFLEFSFDDYPAATTASVPCDGSEYISLPPHKSGTVSSVALGVLGTAPTVVADSSTYEVINDMFLYSANKWPKGRAAITAQWGHGYPPPAVTEVCIELVVNMWRAKDKGLFTDVIGVDVGGVGNSGSVTGYAGALTNQQKMILANVKRKHEHTNT